MYSLNHTQKGIEEHFPHHYNDSNTDYNLSILAHGFINIHQKSELKITSKFAKYPL